MGIEKRIQLIMVSNRLTAASFADKIGVQRSNVSHILNGRNKPGYDFILKIIKSFPNVSSHWLLTGEGTERLSNEVKLFSEDDTKEKVTNVSNEKNQEIGVKQQVVSSQKKIVKTIVFYDDFTFDSYVPNEQ